MVGGRSKQLTNAIAGAAVAWAGVAGGAPRHGGRGQRVNRHRSANAVQRMQEETRAVRTCGRGRSKHRSDPVAGHAVAWAGVGDHGQPWAQGRLRPMRQCVAVEEAGGGAIGQRAFWRSVRACGTDARTVLCR